MPREIKPGVKVYGVPLTNRNADKRWRNPDRTGRTVDLLNVVNSSGEPRTMVFTGCIGDRSYGGIAPARTASKDIPNYDRGGKMLLAIGKKGKPTQSPGKAHNIKRKPSKGTNIPAGEHVRTRLEIERRDIERINQMKNQWAALFDRQIAHFANPTSYPFTESHGRKFDSLDMQIKRMVHHEDYKQMVEKARKRKESVRGMAAKKKFRLA